MTNINCLSNCIYEKNGKCCLDYIGPSSSATTSQKDCAYCIEKQVSRKTPLSN